MLNGTIMLVDEIMPSGKFTKPQLELLRMFSKQFPEKVWEEIRDMLSKYFMNKAVEEMDLFFKEKGWGQEKIDEWSKTHMRKPYKPEE